MQLQSLKLLRLTVKEEIFENTLLDLGMEVTQNVAHYPLHHVSYAATKLKLLCLTVGLGGDLFTRNMKDRTDFGTKLIYPFFQKKSVGIQQYTAQM